MPWRMDTLLLDTLIYLAAAVVAVPLASRLGLGSVLGYLAAGIAIGPVLGLVGSETADLQHVAEFGVVMMLFLIGLELEPRALWAMRHKLVGLGGLQVVVTAALVAAAASALGLAPAEALTLGMIFSLSSTAIVLQTLTERGLMQTPGGRSVFSVLLTQDIAVIPMLAVVPLLGVAGAGADHGDHGPSLSIVEGMPGWGVTLTTLGAVGVVILAGTYLVPPVFRWIHRARLREMYTALALLLVVGTAVLMAMVGLSAALGTFLAGVVLAGSDFRHEIESDIEPFKGLLLGLFFITVGAGIDFQLLFADLGPLVLLTAGVIGIKLAVLAVLARGFAMGRRDGRLFTLSLAQAGEFGFVLVAFARQVGALDADIAARALVIIALSMLVTPLLFLAEDWLRRRAGEEAVLRDPDTIEHEGPVIIAGIGRFGQVVNRLVRSAGFETVVLDNDLATIETMRRFGVRGYFGDPTRPDILNAAGLMKARVLVVALDDPAAAVRLVTYARRERPDLHIVARAYDRAHVYELYAAGARDIVREMFDSSLRAGRYVLENMGLTEYEAAEAHQEFYRRDRAGLRELAELWDPDIPAEKNEAYVRRARELNRDLEVALMGMLNPGDAGDPKREP